MTYFNYHAKVKKLIAEGHLIDYRVVDNWNGITPALVLYFDNNRPMPIREHRFKEYFEILNGDEGNMLKISLEYKFSLGGSTFHACEGDRIKVKTKHNDGMIIEGEFAGCNDEGTTFQVEEESGFVEINCADVIDIMPV